MGNTSGLLLRKILEYPELGLEVWPKLKSRYISPEFSSIYIGMAGFYEDNSRLPNIDELQVSSRTASLKHAIKALEYLEIPEDVDINVLLEALINEFTQDEALTKLEEFVDGVTMMDSDEIKQNLSNIVLYLEEKTHSNEEVCLMSDILLIDEEEIKSRVDLGLNRHFDNTQGVISAGDLIMFGGFRGAGKSIICTNVVNYQYMQGNVGVYFTIEMRAKQVFDRAIAALSSVPHKHIRTGRLSKEELLKIANVRANMFLGGEEAFEQYKSGAFSYKEWEQNLLSKYKLKLDNQIVIVDNQSLTIPDIDLHLQKFKAQFKEKLKLVVVDYVNTIVISDQYDWKSQMKLSQQLKDLADKYEVALVAPFQIDSKGDARYSKGILDKADLAANITAADTHINFKSVKTRNISAFEFNAAIDWECVRIDPDITIDVSEVAATKENLTSITNRVAKVNDY